MYRPTPHRSTGARSKRSVISTQENEVCLSYKICDCFVVVVVFTTILQYANNGIVMWRFFALWIEESVHVNTQGNTFLLLAL